MEAVRLRGEQAVDGLHGGLAEAGGIGAGGEARQVGREAGCEVGRELGRQAGRGRADGVGDAGLRGVAAGVAQVAAGMAAECREKLVIGRGEGDAVVKVDGGGENEMMAAGQCQNAAAAARCGGHEIEFGDAGRQAERCQRAGCLMIGIGDGRRMRRRFRIGVGGGAGRRQEIPDIGGVVTVAAIFQACERNLLTSSRRRP